MARTKERLTRLGWVFLIWGMTSLGLMVMAIIGWASQNWHFWFPIPMERDDLFGLIFAVNVPSLVGWFMAWTFTWDLKFIEDIRVE